MQPTIVFVPGLRGEMPQHWQTLCAEQLCVQGYAVHTVPPIEIDGKLRRARVDNLERVLGDIDGPVVLVAHSAGVLITVHWAQQATRPVQGALLVTPPDFDTPLPPGYSDPQTLRENGWTPVPQSPLPFPSILVGSRNDAVASFERVQALAEAWGSRFVDAGFVGHLSPADGYGAWPAAEELLRQL